MKQQGKISATVRTLLVILVILFVNLIAGKYFKRIDLTEDGRFTVSEVSRGLLTSLDAPAYVNVYFTGEMPTRYKIFEEGIRTFLHELSNYSGGNLDYGFTDPTGNKALFNQLYTKGFEPFPITDLKATSKTDQFVLPYAEITLKGQTKVVNLIKGCIFNIPQERRREIDIDRALQNLEYNIISEIYAMTRKRNSILGLLEGEGEFPKEMMSDLYREIDQYYDIIKVDLRNGRPLKKEDLDVLLVMRPDTSLSERVKFEIDQYIMRGGKVIFLLDNERIDWSIGAQASTLTALRTLNLDDFFGKMGVKVNYDLVEDRSCGFMDATTYTATFGSNMRAKPWTFHPLIRRHPDHPVNRNLSNLLFRFPSSIDTFHISGINKFPLVVTSPYTKRRSGMQFINIDQHLKSYEESEAAYNGGYQTLGLLVGGSLQSLYAGKEVPTDSMAREGNKLPVVNQNTPDGHPQVAIISDGEFASGESFQGKVYDLPTDNKTFMMNLIDYMSGQDLLSRIRVRKVLTRFLNEKQVVGNEITIQVSNVVLPVLLVILFGVVKNYLRKRKNRMLAQ